MSVGNIKNNIYGLLADLKSVHYNKDADVNLEELNHGCAAPYLLVYHYLFTEFNCDLTNDLLSKGFELYGKTDQRFIEALYKILRDTFNYKPPITKEQFFTTGFAERKILMCRDIIRLVLQRYRSTSVSRPPKARQSKSQTMAVELPAHSLPSQQGRREEPTVSSVNLNRVISDQSQTSVHGRLVYREVDSNTHADDDLPPLDIIASTPVKSQPVKSSGVAGSNGSCSVRVQAAVAASAQLQSTLPVVPYDDYIEKCRQLDTQGRALAMLKTQVDELLAAQIAQKSAKSTAVDFNSLAEGLRCCENRLTLIENRLTLLEVKGQSQPVVPVSRPSVKLNQQMAVSPISSQPSPAFSGGSSSMIKDTSTDVSPHWTPVSPTGSHVQSLPQYYGDQIPTKSLDTSVDIVGLTTPNGKVAEVKSYVKLAGDVSIHSGSGDHSFNSSQSYVTVDTGSPAPAVVSSVQAQMANIRAMMLDTEKRLNMVVNSPLYSGLQ